MYLVIWYTDLELENELCEIFNILAKCSHKETFFYICTQLERETKLKTDLEWCQGAPC